MVFVETASAPTLCDLSVKLFLQTHMKEARKSRRKGAASVTPAEKSKEQG
jgi:hypothetical protein